MNYTSQPYATAPGGENLEILIRWGWGILATAGLDRHWQEEHRWPLTAIDNGAWMAHTAGRDWVAADFERACERFAGRARWVAVPDIVCGGLESLRRSEEWLPRLNGVAEHRLIPVQDGIEPADVAPILGADVGVFVGGSTTWKLRTLGAWCRLARKKGAYSHVGRVNSAQRIRMCIAAGADSTDGTSVTRFARKNIRRLSWAHQEVSLWNSI